MKQKTIITLVLSLIAPMLLFGQKVYELTAPKQPKQIVKNKLDMGGTSPEGGSIEVNNYYMSVDGKPVIPVLGEFHFSRYPVEQWEEEIIKMKAGGVNILPTYIFWALHEEYEGKFRWDGNLNLRYFLQLCKKHDMPVIVRIGPFCHGEMRSGAIPEWIFAKALEVRSDDPEYLKYVDRLYGEIAKQIQGLYYKDGGPIVGCQLENEMQHSAAPWAICYPQEPNDYTAASWNAAEAAIGVEGGHKTATGAEAGNEHMRTLYKLARKHGIITPYYTVTGWGNAAVLDNKAIPVTSAYTYPFWENPPRKSPFMMFKDIHADPDYSPVRYNPTDFPSFCAEMGAGIQMVYHSRPIVTAKAAEALMIRTLGSGCNGIGYYMYHGGSTPKRTGQNAFMADEPMGVPKISYDFQAPLGEFGLEGTMYRNLRLIHSFLADWQDKLAPMETVLPKDWNKMTVDNHEDLRYAARMAGESGFLFMVNFQDHDTLRQTQSGIVKINLKNETISIPFVLPKDESMILPFNFDMNGNLLKYSTAQPLMKITDNWKPHYFFFAPDGVKPEYVFEGGKTFRPVAGLKSTFTYKGIKVTTLTRSQALNTTKVSPKGSKQAYIVIADATIMPTEDGVQLLSFKNNLEYIVYPSKKGFATQSISVKEVKPVFTYTQRGPRRGIFHFTENETPEQVHEYFLNIDYTADVAMAFLDGQLCNDEFYHGAPWRIGLKRYANKLKTQDMTFYFRPLQDQSWVRRDLPSTAIPDFSKGPVVDIRKVEVMPQYIMNITF